MTLTTLEDSKWLTTAGGSYRPPVTRRKSTGLILSLDKRTRERLNKQIYLAEISISENIIVFVDYRKYQRLALYELNVGCPSNHACQSVVLDLEVDVKS